MRKLLAIKCILCAGLAFLGGYKNVFAAETLVVYPLINRPSNSPLHQEKSDLFKMPVGDFALTIVPLVTPAHSVIEKRDSFLGLLHFNAHFNALLIRSVSSQGVSTNSYLDYLCFIFPYHHFW